MIREVDFDGEVITFPIRDINEHIQKHWLVDAFYEANKIGMLNFMRTGYQNKSVLDIGACIGNHTLFFEKILGMNVTAIEPHKGNYDHLLETIRLNNLKAKTINVALGRDFGKVSMNTVKNNVGMAYTTQGDDVDVVPLDSLGLSADVIKIDVEGDVMSVIEGGLKTLNKATDIFVEHDTPEEIDRILTNFNRSDRVFNRTPTYLYKRIS